jgi:hypothetical protein
MQATHTHSWQRESHHPCLNLVPELNGIALLCLQASCAEFVVVISRFNSSLSGSERLGNEGDDECF